MGGRGGGLGGRRGIVWEGHGKVEKRCGREMRILWRMHMSSASCIGPAPYMVCIERAGKGLSIHTPCMHRAASHSRRQRKKEPHRIHKNPPLHRISISLLHPHYPPWAFSNAETNLLSRLSHPPQASSSSSSSSSQKPIHMRRQMQARTPAGIPIPNPNRDRPPSLTKRAAAAATRMQPHRHTQQAQAAIHMRNVSPAHDPTPTPPTTLREPSCLAGSRRRTYLPSASMATKDERWRRILMRMRRLKGSSRRCGE